MKYWVLCIWILMIYPVNMAVGVDFGKRATSFAIQEEGFVAMMMRKLKDVDWKKEEEKMTKIAAENVNNPMPVAGIKPAIENREFWHDPTYRLDKDAVLPCGKVLHKAGSQVNPLDHMNLDRRLFFVDGREEKQVQWLKENFIRNASGEVGVMEDRVILVGGSVFKLQEELGSDVYFDQFGELTTKFGIKASPAIAVQDGKRLKIEEFVLDTVLIQRKQ